MLLFSSSKQFKELVLRDTCEVAGFTWFMITSLSDWFKVLAPLFQPITSESKTNSGSRVNIFPCFVSVTCK